MDQTTLMIVAVVAMLALAVWTLLGGETEGEKARSRMKTTIGGESKDGGGTFGFLKKEDNNARRRQIEESLGKIEEAQKDKTKQRNSLKGRLVQANWTTAPQTYMLISVIVGAAIGAVVFLLSGKALFALGGAVGGGYVLPRFVLNFAINRRQKKFIGSFADAMEIIVRGVRSGLPLGDCLKVIAHESPEPVAGEFKLVVQGEQVGVPLEVCLERMYERMPLPEVNFFNTVLAIQRTTGGNLGEALENLASVLRGRKILREKIKALSAEAKMSAIIIGSLPIVVMGLVTISSPEYMTELYTTPTGHRNLMIGACMMVMGTLIMRKMINFKI